jgi:hypothetical protein
MRKIVRWSVSIGIVLLFVGTSIAQVPNLNSSQNGVPKNLSKGTYTFNPTDDSYVSTTNPDENNNNLDFMAIRNAGSGGGWMCAGVIKFDISSIPTNAVIITATLGLFYFDWADNNPAGRLLSLRCFEANWNEETITNNNMPSFNNQVSATANVPPSPGVWMTVNVTSDVQKFVAGTIQNYGWIIKDDQYWGGYNIPAAWFYTKEHGSFIPYLQIVVNDPPVIPQITGQANGTVGQSYDYTFIASDPNGEQIYYTIEWGDGQTNIWIGPYTSGQPVTIPHSWDKKGTYTIKAKAKDIHDAESDWGTLVVNMPLSSNNMGLHFFENFFEKLFERFPHALPILRLLLGY